MARTDGTLARKLAFDETTANSSNEAVSGRRAMLRLARALPLAGPAKYRVLEVRRRRAQIKARRLLDLMDVQEKSQSSRAVEESSSRAAEQ